MTALTDAVAALKPLAEAALPHHARTSSWAYDDALAALESAATPERVLLLIAAAERAAKIEDILRQALDADAIAEWFMDTDHDGIDIRAALEGQ